MKIIMNSSVLIALLAALTAVLIRYLTITFPAPGIDHNLVSSRLTLVQHAAILVVLIIAILMAIREKTKARKIRLIALTLAAFGAYGLANYDGSPRDSEAVHTHLALPSKYKFSRDWVTPHDGLWRDVLQEFKDKPNISALEIGSFEGRSTIWFLENILTHPTARITCVDLWSGIYRSVDRFEETFDRNVQAYGAPRKVIKLKGKSEDILGQLKPQSFDFIYVDGSHFSHDALSDAVMSWRLLKPGGYMIFDDYDRWDFRMRLFPHITAKRGIDAFVAIFGPYVEVLHRQAQLVLRKKEEPAELDTYPRLQSFVEAVQRFLATPG